ncbi:hypothetical protein LTR50_003313 [Elasticomyces elasticus]|nr:hypothetical protein LTR50_003313 [Elasticomyces elasticus]
MADFIKGLFGAATSSVSSALPSADADFADFASVPDPSPAPLSASLTSTASASASSKPLFSWGAPPNPDAYLGARKYTKWYRIWERTTLADFYIELFVLPLILIVLLVHTYGTRTNKRKAQQWASTHAPVLQHEFAVVGFGGRKAPKVDDVSSQGLLKATQSESLIVPEELLKEKSKNEYITYATGRQNVAFVDIKLTLLRRYNPIALFGDAALAFFLDSMPAPVERMEATAYSFDGKESEMVKSAKAGNSTYDGFVWAIVHKDSMATLRNDRYDLSLTSTKDHPKLPIWATVMSESAEVTEAMLTPELLKAVEECGEDLEALVVSDQPMEQPKKLDETIPRKRISLSYRLTSRTLTSTSIFAYFLRLPDFLVSTAHFRPEVMRRIRQTREDEIRKIKKVDDEEKAEGRRVMSDKAKKEKRDGLLKGMGAEEQRKFLDKEREKDTRRSQKRRTTKA